MAMTATQHVRARARDSYAPITTAWPETVALSWSVGMGVMVGGVWIAVNSQMSGGGGFLVLMTALFCIGSVLGYVHGGVLGMLGRPAGMTRRGAVRRLVRFAPLQVPVLTVGWLVAAWVALTPMAGANAPWSLSAGVVGSWAGALVILGWAALQGWSALRNAYARWPHYRVGTATLVTTFVVLSLAFMERRPVIWGTDLRVTAAGAVVLALGATVWFASPLVILLLQWVRRREVR